MRKVILGLLLVGLLCVPAMANTRLDFQNYADFAGQITTLPYSSAYASGTCNWVQSSNGGNSYMQCTIGKTNTVGGLPIVYTGIQNANPSFMDYAAVTFSGWSTASPPGTPTEMDIILKDSSGTILFSTYIVTTNSAHGRVEMKISGTVATFYNNGVQFAQSGSLGVYPSYVEFTTGATIYTTNYQGSVATFDDLVFGSTGSKYVFGMPEDNLYYIKKDMINPSASGFYYANDTLISSFNFTSTWSKATGTPETLGLEENGGAIILTANTGTAYNNSQVWPLAQFFASNPLYGYYTTTIRPQNPTSAGFVTSHVIPYIGSGATIVFDKASYQMLDSATLTYAITSGYWDLSTYTYALQIVDIYGTVVYNQAINQQTGSATVTITSPLYTQGVYYGQLVATKTSDSSTILMNYDTEQVYDYVALAGYVMNAETGAVLSGASINVTQGTTSLVSNSLATGAWNSSNQWLVGSHMTINTSKSGYTSDTNAFTPLVARTIPLNISLIPFPASTTGTSIGGIVTDSTYHAPVPGATVTVVNGTYNTAVANIAGYYRVNNRISGKLYSVWSSLNGYGNSTVAYKLAVGT